MKFKSNIVDENPDQKIIVKVCSDKECDDKVVNIFIKSFEIEVESEPADIYPGEEFIIDLSVKNFNTGNSIVNADYDKNWFELLSNNTNEVEEDTTDSIR